MDKRYFVISNTHWDREWRQPFQRHRMALVEMIDTLLDTLEQQPEYRAFHLDSQSVVLEDYLEIRPNKKELLEKFIKAGRILVGPWYILPDEYFVGGENLIRNLLMGHEISRKHGRVSKIGYSPFSWGQISQLPQIYKGFGIDLIMFYRGVNSLESPGAEFIWEGADGTRSLSSRFSTMPRYNFYFGIYRPVVQGYTAGEVKYDMNQEGQLLHPSDSQQFGEDYQRRGPKSVYDEKIIEASVKKLTEDQDQDFASGQVIWMEGHDSSGSSSETVRLIQDIRKHRPDLDVRHATLEEYRDALMETLNTAELPLVRGERRSAQFDHRSGNLFGYTLSARMYLKQMNFDVERWLQRYAEPMDTLSGILGMDNEDNYLKIAWRDLIQNSAHDSIGGCSLDLVHEDGVQRYKAAREISQGVFRRGFEYLAGQIGGVKLGSEQEALILFNPLSTDIKGVQELYIDLPESTQQFELSDVSGNPVEIQILETHDVQPVLEQLTDRPLHLDRKRVRILADVSSLPALGYTSLIVTPEKQGQVTQSEELKLVISSAGSPVLENRWLQVSFHTDGSFDILDKRTSKRYEHLGEFQDTGEAGHAWVHTPTDPILSSQGVEAKFKIKYQGSLAVAVEVDYQLDGPKDIQTDARRKTAINAVYTLFKAGDTIQVDLNIHNDAPNHRLRYAMATNMAAASSYGEGQFDVVGRPVSRPDTSEWVEQPMYDHPMHHFVDVSDGNHGLAVLVDGLKEYEVTETQEQTLFITLFRAFSHVVVPSSVEDHSHEPGSQCLGSQSYRLAIMPHQGDWQTGRVMQAALKFDYMPRSMQASQLQGTLPAECGFFAIESSDLVLSALKQAEHGENGIVLRSYNPTGSTIKSRFNSYFKLQSAASVNLEESQEEEIPLEDSHHFYLHLNPKQILTLKLVIDHE